MPINPYFRMQGLFGGSTPPAAPVFNTPLPRAMTQPIQMIDEDQNNQISAIERFKNAVLNPPQRGGFDWKRALMTGALSAIREEPDQIQETIVEDPGTPRRVQRNVSSRGAVSYSEYPETPSTSRKTTQIKRGSKWNPMGYEEASGIMNAPYARKLEDWKLHTGALERAAQEERQLLNAESLRMQREGNLDVSQTREGRLREQGLSNIAIRNRLADLAEWKAKNPNGIIKGVQGGNYIVIDPQTGETIDTGAPTGSMSREMELRLMGDIRSGQIAQQGAISQGNIAAAGEQARLTKGTPSGGVAGEIPENLPPSQQRTALIMKAQRLIAANPDWAQYLEMDPETQLPRIKAPARNRFSSGPDEATYREIYQALYGPTVAPTGTAPIRPATVPKKAITNRPLATAPPAPTGWKYVPKSGGGWTAVPSGGR